MLNLHGDKQYMWKINQTFFHIRKQDFIDYLDQTREAVTLSCKKQNKIKLQFSPVNHDFDFLWIFLL